MDKAETIPTSVTTSRFHVAPSLHARSDMARIAQKYCLVAALPLVALFFAGMADWRWWVVALAFVFLIVPLIAMFAWISVLGRRDAVLDMYPHEVSLAPSGTIRVNFFPHEPMPDDGGESGDGPRTAEAPAPLELRAHDITGLKFTKNHLALSHTCKESCGEAPGRGTLMIPFSAFASAEEMQKFVKTVGAFMRSC